MLKMNLCDMMKKAIIQHVIYGLSVCAVTGCTDEIIQDQPKGNGRGINFSVEVKNGWDMASGTRGQQPIHTSTPVQMEGGTKTLFLQTEVLDGLTTLKIPMNVSEKQAQAYPKLANAERRYADAEGVQAVTRGMMRTTSDLYDAIGVLAYSFSGTWDGTQTPDFMYNLKAAKGSGIYATTSGWPDADTNVRFYSYAPHSGDAEGITMSAATVAGPPQLTYAVPDDITKQSDLLATLCDETATAAHTSPQTLEFHHLLTAVCFKVGDDMVEGTISKITLTNIKYKGTYTFPAATPWTSDKGMWAVDADLKSFTYTPSSPFSTDGTKNAIINEGENMLMLLPQTLDDDATLEVEFTDSETNTTETYSANIKGLVAWEQGKTVVYTLNIDPNSTKFYLTVSLDKASYSSDGEDGTLSVISYKETQGTKDAVAWTITGFSTDNGATWRESPSTNLKDNEVIDFANLTGTGGESPQDQGFSVYNTDYNTTVPKTSDLTNATPAVDVDLSCYDVEGNAISRSTANCYVVRAPGTYKFPVVYGNGIKNGVETNEGYKSTIDPDTFTVFTVPPYDVYLANGDLWYHYDGGELLPARKKQRTLIDFPNGYGDVITNSWIHKNSHSGSPLTPKTAELVWTDAENLIRTENVSLSQSGDEYYVNFEIKKDDIVEGNALIQVMGNDDTVLWSWHIWVTNADFGQSKTITVSKANNMSYTFMAVPLGCIDEADGTYSFEEREVLVKVKQDESGKEAIVRLSQPEKQTNDRVIYMTNYQWGRKDPIPYKDVDGLVIQTQGRLETRIPMYEAIQHPNYFYYTSPTAANLSSWHSSNAENFNLPSAGSEGISNLWDINLAYTASKGFFWDLFFALQRVSKSIYDPCPVGYHVGDGYAWADFAQEPAAGIQANRDTGTYDPYIGKTYHVKNGTADVDVFFPVTNLRNASSPIYKGVNSFMYWTSAYSEPILGGGIYFYARCYSNYSRYYGGNAYCAYAVYPIKD